MDVHQCFAAARLGKPAVAHSFPQRRVQSDDLSGDSRAPGVELPVQLSGASRAVANPPAKTTATSSSANRFIALSLFPMETFEGIFRKKLGGARCLPSTSG